MALRAVRRSSGNNALDWMLTSSQIAANVSAMLPFPPTMAGGDTPPRHSFKSSTTSKPNQQECFRLAHRAARLLTALGRRMEGKWDDAPESLLENIREFEVTLLSIRDFMLGVAQTKWIGRFMAKSSIQDCVIALRGATEGRGLCRSSSQSLIEIHYAIGSTKGNSSTKPLRITGEDIVTVTSPVEFPEPLSSQLSMSECSVSTFDLVDQNSRCSRESTESSFTFVEADPEALVTDSGSQAPVIPEPTEEDLFLADLSGETDEFGFRRYHQSDVIVRKANRKAVGWFAGTSEAQAGGQKTTIKKFLIASGAVQSRDLASAMQSALTTRGLADCACLILKTYREISSAIAHAQQQLSLSENEAQDFIDHATYSIDSDNNIVVGLPAPREGWVTARSYGLEESLADRALQELMNSEETALQAGTSRNSASLKKFKQLKALLHSLLPRQREGPALLPELEDPSRRQQTTTIQLPSAHCEHSASSNRDTIRRDYGYIPGGSTDFANFVRLGNILNDLEDGKAMEVVGETHGTMLVRTGGPGAFPPPLPQRQPASPFALPDEMECWPVALPPQGNAVLFAHHETGLASVNAAWRLLIAQRRDARLDAWHHAAGPHPRYAKISLNASDNNETRQTVTRSLRIDDHQIDDWKPSLPPVPSRATGFRAPAFPQHWRVRWCSRIPASRIRCTGASDAIHRVPRHICPSRTSRRILRITLWAVLARVRPDPPSWCFSCRSGSPVGYVDFIQLDAEDVDVVASHKFPNRHRRAGMGAIKDNRLFARRPTRRLSTI
ncbi:hypothetical protein H4582DRAFT_2079564 [Lactarius indigo]|nr:hypothetical protein H4582DRAFT_2079564 [Lactarius indigo]